MAKYLLPHAQTKGNDDALIDERGSTSWLELNNRVNQLIAAMRAIKLEAGDVIGIFSGNCREYFEIVAAASHAGVTYVPINWHFTADELAYVTDNSGCKLLFIEDQFAHLADDLNEVQTVCIRGGSDSNGATAMHYEAWLEDHSSAEPENQAFGATMFYTSGTTGKPKGVKGKTASEGPPPIEILEMMSAGITGMLSIPAAGRTLLSGPVYHSAQWAFTFPLLVGGSTVVMRHGFDAAETLRLIDEHKITNTHFVPIQFKRMLSLDQASREAFDGSSLQVCWHGAAPCSPETKRAMIDWWGPIVGEYYGSTEGAIISVATAEEWLAKPGTVGKPSAIMEVTIMGENGISLPAGETGDVYVRNLMGSDFEYHNEEEKTAAAHASPGVYTFGDVGHIDADGYLFLSDRKIDMIISGGVNIYPAEVEGVLTAHPAVEDVAVFGIPNDEYGEEVKAAVCLKNGNHASDELSAALIDYCREQLAGYKAPKSIDYHDQLPRIESGKLAKATLRAPYWESSGRKI